jgi:hypothetical protein
VNEEWNKKRESRDDRGARAGWKAEVREASVQNAHGSVHIRCVGVRILVQSTTGVFMESSCVGLVLIFIIDPPSGIIKLPNKIIVMSA